ncbi:predicted protein [Nematostella vectensis]|uniref:AB hydrolase-1 domain-containing protein n=1 Tax=Nematostella vectensis TaxID=45351 RepID=A7RFZ6_NEMVE|nr:predicted protein [Nematostella vectensis]|eukprot:XP_001641873.1 predicted protein [Nematostella vectensis]
MFKLAIFDLGGVVATSLKFAIEHYAWKMGVPYSLLQKLFLPSNENQPMWQLETGKISLSQFFVSASELISNLAEEEGIKLPPRFSLKTLFDQLYKTIKVVPEMLNAAAALKANGFRTCIVSNNWTDDTETGQHVSGLSLIRPYFDDFFESCKIGIRKPDPEMYKLVCKKFKVQPNEVLFLDDLPSNLAPAKEMGMATILVKDPISALRTVKEITGIDVLKAYPTPACTPSSVPHSIVQLKTGIMMHYVDIGHGHPIILLHGFPELWYIWKYQGTIISYGVLFEAKSDAKLACTQLLYSPSDKIIVFQDIISLMDLLLLRQVAVIGHDWGGMVAWDLALHHPDRIRAVANMTPFMPPNPDINPLLGLKAKPGVFQYQLYFHQEGPPEAEFEKDLRRTFKLFLRNASEMEQIKLSTSDVLERGGFFVGTPEKVERSCMITEEDLDYFVENFRKTGFRGPLNWYRNMEVDWKWNLKIHPRKILQPVLMITSGKDPVILPAFAANMGAHVPNLSLAHIEESSHFTPIDRPLELNNMLLDWLKRIYGSETSKL